MPVGQAAAAQVVAVAISMAEARRRLRSHDVQVVNSMATNAVNVCALALGDNRAVEPGQLFGISSTVRLVYNSSPVKVTAVSVLSACRTLARNELGFHTISNAMGNRNEMLLDICRSLVGEHTLEPVWCAFVLVVYLTSHPRGRDLLRTSGLTDVDVQAAIVAVRYGSEEVNRRSGAQKRPKRAHGGVEGSEEEQPDDDAHSAASSSVACKRKRAPRGSSGTTTSEAHVLLSNWHAYLSGPHASVLHTLAAHNKRTARDAALCTLAQQAEGTEVAENEMLQEASLRNAERSATALVSMVGRRESEVPGVLVLSARRNEDGPYGKAVSLQRVEKEAASTALHACVMPPHSVRPDSSVRIAVAWSAASQKLMPRDEQQATLPGILERLYEIRRLYAETDASPLRGKSAQREGSLRNFVATQTEDPMLIEAAGTTRSFLSIVMVVPFNYTQDSTAEQLCGEALEAYRYTHEAPNLGTFPTLLYTSKRSCDRREPLCTPAPSLAVGIYANESIRRWMARKTRKNDPCIKHLGYSMPSELSRDVPSIMSSEPSPMLTITDFDVELSRETEWPRNMDCVSYTEAAVGLHVCGDGVTRLPEILEAMQDMKGLGDAEYTMQARAALYVAASQASFVGAIGSALSAGYAITSVASSKKITVRCQHASTPARQHASTPARQHASTPARQHPNPRRPGDGPLSENPRVVRSVRPRIVHFRTIPGQWRDHSHWLHLSASVCTCLHA